jgi:hypothetical protein
MNDAVIYIMSNAAVLILILGQLFRIEARLGKGEELLDRLKKKCPFFNGGINGNFN